MRSEVRWPYIREPLYSNIRIILVDSLPDVIPNGHLAGRIRCHGDSFIQKELFLIGDLDKLWSVIHFLYC